MGRPNTTHACALLTIALVCGTAFGQVNQEMIDRIAAGEVTEAHASWWGFDPEDSTEALQAAINSGAATLIVENMGAPWIVRPIELASNQEIVFEEGVEILAKREEFKDRRDCLFMARDVENLTLRGYGATFRMWRDDYDDPEQYEKAEWRHTLTLRGVTDVTILGLTFAESGGDGIYLGTGPEGATNLNVHIKDVVCESNYRQGISVITAENLLIEDTVMRNTAGTPPQAGIDLEPNRPWERLVNVLIRNCLSENNAGSGYTFNIRPLTAESEPVSVRIENCRSVNDGGHGGRILANSSLEGAPEGTIEFIDCVFVGNGRAGIMVTKPAERGLVRFERCEVLDSAMESPGVSPIMIASRQGADTPSGGIEFIDIALRDPLDRSPMSYTDQGGVPWSDISGNIILVDADGNRQDVALTEELLAGWMPSDGITYIPRLALDLGALRPLTTEHLEQPRIDWPFMRRAVEMVIYADAGDEVSFMINFQPVGARTGRDATVAVTAPSGEVVCEAAAVFGAETPISFVATDTGGHLISVDARSNRLHIAEPSHPVSLSMASGSINFIRQEKDFAFYVPRGVEHFGVRISGEGTGEAVAAALIDPSGEIFGEIDNRAEAYQFEVELERPSEGEVWVLQVRQPSELYFEDHFVDLRGIPPLLAPAGAPLLVPAGN